MLRALANLLLRLDAALDRMSSVPRIFVELVFVFCTAFCLYWIGAFAIILGGALSLEVTCPAAPTDIPAYACTLGEYFERMTIGGWSFFGHVLYFFGALMTALCGYMVYKMVSLIRADSNK